MIEIKRDRIICCSSCFSVNDDIISIYLRHDNSAGGQMIQLCDNCRKELIKTLQEVE